MKLPLLAGPYSGRSGAISDTSMINYYIERGDSDDRSQMYAVPTPGTTTFQTANAGQPIRAMYFYNNLMLTVCGNTLYSITQGGVVTSIGTLVTSTGLVQMEDNGINNGHQVLMCDTSGNGYVYDSNLGTVVQLNNGTNGWPTPGGAPVISWQDGYGLLMQGSSNVFWNTNAYNFSTTQGLNFYSKAAQSDNLVSLISDGTRLYLFGSRSMEIWYDIGSANAAFGRLPGAEYFKGCAAAYSPAIIDNSVMWLSAEPGGRPSVLQIRGAMAPTAVTTTQIDWQLAQYATVSDAFSFVYKQEGHEFYVLTFPTAGVTWVYDVSTRMWHNRSSGGGAWFPQAFAFCWGTQYVGDSVGVIHALSSTATTEQGGNTINRTIVSPYIVDQHERLYFDTVEVMTNAGIGSGPISGSFTLSWSKNQGNTFPSSWTYTFTNSKTQRSYYKRLGRSYQWLFQLTTTSNPIIFDFFGTLNYRTEGAPTQPQ